MKLLCAVIMVTALSALPVWGDAASGKAVYDKSCKNCHGVEGQGNPAVAKMLKVEMRPLGSKEVQAKSDEELKKAITAGTGKMRPVANLSSKQVDDVVAYLRTLQK